MSASLFTPSPCSAWPQRGDDSELELCSFAVVRFCMGGGEEGE